jgi:hypothetical protein
LRDLISGSHERAEPADGEEPAEQIPLVDASWSAITQYVTVDRCLWRAPAALFSVLVLVTENVTVVVPGVVHHYQSLQAEILDRLRETGNEIRHQALDVSLLRSRWTLAALVLTILLTTITLPDWLNHACRDPNLQLALLRAGNYAYLVDGEGDVQSVQNVQKPEHLRTIGLFDVPGAAKEVVTAGRYLYVVDGTAGRLRVVDVSRPTLPSEVGSTAISKQTGKLAVDRGFVYLSDHSGGLQIVDVRNPTTPVAFKFYKVSGEVFDLAVAHKRVYLANGREGLRIIDVANPAAPAEVGFFATDARAVAVSGRYAYVVGSGGLQVVDVIDPAKTTEVGFSPAVTEATLLDKQGSHIFLAGSSRTLWVFNVYDPDKPTLVRTYAAPGPIADLAVALGYVFLATADVGIYVVDFLKPCGEIDEVGGPVDLKTVQKIALLKPYPLPITSVVYELLRWGLLIFPLVSLAQLIHNRILERRLLGARFRFDPSADWSIGLAFVFFLLWTLYEISRLTH